MDIKLCRQACEIIGCQFIGYHQFLTDAIVWAGKNVAEFGLRYDDFSGLWLADGIYTIDATWELPDPTADNPHDVMAKLIVDYCAWHRRLAAARSEETK